MLTKEIDGILLDVVLEARDPEILHVLGREDVHAERHVLQVLLTLARGDDDFLKAPARIGRRGVGGGRFGARERVGHGGAGQGGGDGETDLVPRGRLGAGQT